MLASCSRPALQAGGVRHIAIPPANILLDDAAADWVGLASSIVLQNDLATSASVVPVFARDDSSSLLANASERIDLTFSGIPGWTVLSVTDFRLDTQKGSHLLDRRVDVSRELIPVLDELARRLDPNSAQPFSTRKLSALKLFVEAATASVPQNRAKLLQSAIQEDPSFGLASIALAETVGPMALSGVHPERFSPFERARWNALAARLQGASPQQQIQRQLEILRLAPNNVDALATLGTLRFLSGDRKDGERQLRRALELNPGNLAVQVQLQRLLQSQPAKH